MALPALVAVTAVALPVAVLSRGHEPTEAAGDKVRQGVASPTPLGRSAVTDQRRPSSSPSKKSAAIGAADRSVYSDPASLWVVVNKRRPLTSLEYAPTLSTVGDREVDVRMAPHLQDLLDAARSAGTPLRVVSGYRSYDHQVEVYDREVTRLGRKQADRLSARPGHSEHQTGLAVDVDNLASGDCQLEACFGTTAGGEWLAANAAEFGFIIRYTAENQKITGYEQEPWHLRYVGKDLANKLATTGAESLEQYFGTAGGNYADE
jgi:D-alanyl-D-alanine carboxypeptidase